MRKVNIGDLKARLSAHLQLVRKGEEVLVCDRNRPMARIIPITSDEYSAQERRLIAKGVMIPPRRKRKASDPWPEPAGNIPDKVMKEVWRREREGR